MKRLTHNEIMFASRSSSAKDKENIARYNKLKELEDIEEELEK